MDVDNHQTLISKPYFKMKHQSHVMNDLNSKKFLVSQWRVGEENKFNLYSSPLSLVQPAVEDIEKLDSPSNRKPSMLHCSCDGLVLLSIADRLLVWNPSTREIIELPRLEYTRERCSYGLGYDSTSDEYKILKFHFDGSEILALKSGNALLLLCSLCLQPIHMFADGEVLLNYRCIDHVGSNLPFRTSKGPFGLWPQNNILKQGIIYTVSLIFSKSLI
ncbi:hypothetical protein H5410_044306 [Solanum commersonii]|uniref:F-box associated beta-propeller type 1 domain-containing protein n=1 Tax=Solanum commersonii TaxID=4109 RepID=A0A9J5XAH0_SOLCO|nr:hypothetical protein H5410_044306 [Solanum commersonii]